MFSLIFYLNVFCLVAEKLVFLVIASDQQERGNLVFTLNTRLLRRFVPRNDTVK
jgi:hypothetical protein